MTWREWLAARQLLAEEFLLAPEREWFRQKRAEEDAAFKRASERLRSVK